MTTEATEQTAAVADQADCSRSASAEQAAPPPLVQAGIELPTATNGDATTSENGHSEALQKPLQKAGKPVRKVGGQPGNEARVTTGVSLWRRKGRFPRKHKGARKRLLEEGDLVEAELMQEGPLSAWQSRLLGSFMRAEGVATLLDLRLAANADTASNSELCTMSAQLLSADVNGTKLLEKLGVDHDRNGNGRPAVNGHRRGPGIEELPPTLLAEIERGEA